MKKYIIKASNTEKDEIPDLTTYENILSVLVVVEHLIGDNDIDKIEIIKL
jgi:hypothetical protein